MNFKGLLNPKKYNYIKTFRNKKFKFYKKKKFKFGDFGIFNLLPFYINFLVLVKFIRIIRANFKRKLRNYRFFFINYNFNYIYTKKPKGSRMGKGKGKKKVWFSKLRIGSIFLEFKNYRFGKCIWFVKKLFKITNSNFFYKINTIKRHLS